MDMGGNHETEVTVHNVDISPLLHFCTIDENIIKILARFAESFVAVV